MSLKTPPETKVCPKCSTAKSSDGFYVRRVRGQQRLSGWCRACTAQYESRRRRQRTDQELASGSSHRRCHICKELKSIDAFSALNWKCRPCGARYQRDLRQADPLLQVRAHLRSKYGLTLEDYEAMLAAQGGGCAICGTKPTKIRLHVDHDHACCPVNKKSCGKCIRGLVCYPCNTKLAILESDSVYAVRIREYAQVKVVAL